MIIDCFTFGWELDLLECRLEELDDHVDMFVIVEAQETFQGNSKPYHFALNHKRYSKWLPKIRVERIPTFKNVTKDNPWLREGHSRDVIENAIHDVPDDAIILVSDVDEIPHPDGIQQAVEMLKDNDSVCFVHKLYSMAVDWEYPANINGTVATTKKFMDTLPSYSHIRSRIMTPPAIQGKNGGWHFTWLGGKEFIRLKAASFSHTEDSVQNYVRDMAERLYTEGYHVHGEKLIPVDVDTTFPKYIREGRCPDIWFRPR